MYKKCRFSFTSIANEERWKGCKMKKTNDQASYYFHQGTNFMAYKYMGCTLDASSDGFNYVFRVWAPNALSVGLVSDFTGWDEPYQMECITDGGIYECSYHSLVSLERSAYKFRIKTKAGNIIDKGDPFAAFSRGGADGASLIFADNAFVWNDADWINHRRKSMLGNGKKYMSLPINIYEIHLGSFLRHDDGSYYSYRELANILPGYIKHLGYTHVEFLPLQEFPYDGSWGYQVCGFYAPTSRFGDPDEFRILIDALHRSGIGVILDWVPAHFPKDAWGLYEFDGEPLYEYQGLDRRESASWGTRFFDLGREEVQSFLISNALYFFREFHLDGLRVDAVASMIYLDYDRMPGEWFPNSKGTNENIEATEFIKKLNKAVFGEFPDVMMIAEESTAFAKVTAPVHDGGLGFNLKWNMGWANDFYDYLMTDPVYRKHKHTALNFPLMYAFSENYCLPISHDEVVHGKLSFANKMFGEYEDKFKQMRTALMLQMTYPGKKLLFMGTEFAQFREWNFEDSLEWFMLDYPTHESIREYVTALNRFYLSSPMLWDLDFSEKGFEWIYADESERNIVAYRRFDSDGESLIIVLNFSGAEQTLPLTSRKGRKIECVFETMSGAAKLTKCNISDYSITLSGFSGAILAEKSINKKIIFKEKDHVL